MHIISCGDNSVNIHGKIMVLVHGTSSHFHLYTLYTPSFISIPFLLYKIWAGQATIMKTWLRGNNSVNIQGRIMALVPFLSLLSIYKPSFIPIPFVLSIKDMARTGNNYEKWLWGDNSINILCRSMVHGHSPSPYCHLSIYQVLFKCNQ